MAGELGVVTHHLPDSKLTSLGAHHHYPGGWEVEAVPIVPIANCGLSRTMDQPESKWGDRPGCEHALRPHAGSESC